MFQETQTIEYSCRGETFSKFISEIQGYFFTMTNRYESFMFIIHWSVRLLHEKKVKESI